jgi:hypothetical protein
MHFVFSHCRLLTLNPDEALCTDERGSARTGKRELSQEDRPLGRNLPRLTCHEIVTTQEIGTQEIVPASENRGGPDPQGGPGFLRIDSVHRGDWEGAKGFDHINAVDAVTQWQVVGCAGRISEQYLLARVGSGSWAVADEAGSSPIAAWVKRTGIRRLLRQHCESYRR